ncbi:MAG: ABC transporter permease subunit [Rhodothalassiaceae bacterium]
MNTLIAVMKREFSGYFATPVALVFLIVYLMLSGIFGFFVGGFYERGEADLDPFFQYQPWLFLFLVPAVSMRLWAEERRSGTLELLLTLPIPTWAAILGKFLAAWLFIGLALALSFPNWIIVSWLGDPDHGVILAGYIGTFLMAGGYLAIGTAMSALTRNQVIAFVLAASVGFLFTVSGLPIVLSAFEGWAPEALTTLIASFSFLSRYAAIVAGVLDLKDLLYFLTQILLWLFLSYLILESRKGAS